MTKKKNPPDDTGRNRRATRKMVATNEDKIKDLTRDVRQLQRLVEELYERNLEILRRLRDANL